MTDKIFRWCVVMGRDARRTTSGGSIFRCTAKDRGERRAKGLRPPLDPRSNVLGHSDVLCAYVFATVRVTRLSRAWRAPHCFHALCVLRPDGDAKRRRRKCPWGTLLRKTARLMQPPNFRPQIRLIILKVPTFSPQLEQYNRVRGSSVLAHATDGPKSRQLHYGEHVQSGHVSPPNPRIKSQIPKGGFGALWRVFLRYLSSRKERYRHRRSLV